MGSLIEVVDDDAVRFLTLNRPDRLNALNSSVLEELLRCVETAGADLGVGCVVIRGAGDRAFCAGADLGEIRGLSAEEAHAFIRRGQRAMTAVESARMPVIAAVDGFALGGGFELMLACHLAVSSDRSTSVCPRRRSGACPASAGRSGCSPRRARRSFYLMLTGASIDAEHAWQIGLLSVPPIAAGKLPDRVAGLAHRVASGSRGGMSKILEAGRRAALPTALEHEAALAALAIASLDGQEGITAFAERRPPEFDRSTGR